MYCIPRNRLPVRPLAASGPEPPKLSGIKTGLLIPGRGEPIKNGAVVIHEDKITWVGPQSALPAKYSALSFIEVPVLLPGLWDCHVHYFGSGSQGPADDAGPISLPAAQAGARVAVEFARTLRAGYTSVREVGGYGGEVFPA